VVIVPDAYVPDATRGISTPQPRKNRRSKHSRPQPIQIHTHRRRSTRHRISAFLNRVRIPQLKEDRPVVRTGLVQQLTFGSVNGPAPHRRQQEPAYRSTRSEFQPVQILSGLRRRSDRIGLSHDRRPQLDLDLPHALREIVEFGPGIHTGSDVGPASAPGVVAVSDILHCAVTVLDNFDTQAQRPMMFDEYLYVLEGSLTILSGEDAHELGPGDAIWMPKGAMVQYQSEQSTLMAMIYPANWQEQMAAAQEAAGGEEAE